MCNTTIFSNFHKQSATENTSEVQTVLSCLQIAALLPRRHGNVLVFVDAPVTRWHYSLQL